METTKYKYLSKADQFRKLPSPPLEKPFSEDGKFVSLPQPSKIHTKPLDLRSAIESRRSLRRYAEEPLTIEELAYLLWCTQGLVERHDPYATFRTVPSAGGRHSFETYLMINRVHGLQPGLYRYLSFSHRLLAIDSDPELAHRIAEACLGQAVVRDSAVTFIWSCVIYRMAWRYSERAYRLVHLDAGLEVQREGLPAGSSRCRTCLPEPLSRCSADRLRSMCNRSLR